MKILLSFNFSNRGVTIDGVRAVIMAFMVIMFIGYIFIWVMTLTNIFRKEWFAMVRSHTKSIYFGNQGPSILVYTCPMLLVAIMGGLYLHLGTKSNHNSQRKNHEKMKPRSRLGVEWKRPMVVKGLGIVSRTEIAFFFMFIVLLVWSLVISLHNSFANINSDSLQGEKMWEAKLESVGLRLGLIGNILLVFLFYPVTRGSSILPIIGLTSESSVKYHIWLGHLTMIFFTGHGICYVLYWDATNQLYEILEWAKYDNISNLAGVIALLCGLVMWVTAISRIRRKAFEIFFYSHQLYALFVVFFVFHVGVNFICKMLPGFFLFLVDRFLRFLQSRRSVRLVSAHILPCNVVQLDFAKTRGMNLSPTSIIFLNVPSISKLQWHPFTVVSSSRLEPETLSVVIKCDGNWSRRLFNTLKGRSHRLEIAVEGPYGPVSNNFLSHDTLIMVSGGSGIAPFISIIRELIFLHETLKTPEILLISVFKNSSDLAMLELILPSIGPNTMPANFIIRIEAYVTRENQPSSPEASARTVYLKPGPEDAPISPVLGPNGWLWLSVVICSSFVMFLVLLGIMTRYYIYPIEQNTNHVYPYPSRAFLNMVLICASISVAACAAFYRNKKQLARDTNQITSIEGVTSTVNSRSGFIMERGLESLPLEPLLEFTTVHYGQRPDLKRILFERKESSIGVLASGPRQLRRDVARICSTCLEDNLHFESISFTW